MLLLIRTLVSPEWILQIYPELISRELLPSVLAVGDTELRGTTLTGAKEHAGIKR